MTKTPKSQRLWMINHHASHPSESNLRHFMLAHYLLDHGWTTTILASSIRHPTGLTRFPSQGGVIRETGDGVDFAWLPGPEYKGSRIKRVANMLHFTFQLLLPRTTRSLTPPTAILGSTVHPLAAWGAMRLAKRYRVPFIFEIRDLWPETLIELGGIRRRGLLAKALRHLEHKLCKEAVAVVTTMPLAYKYLETSGVPREKVHWISNGVDIRAFRNSLAEAPQPHEQSPRFNFTYFGSLGIANAVHLLVEGFKGSKAASTCTLNIVGGGPDLHRLETLADGHEDSIRIHGPVPKQQIPRFASAADCLVVAVQDSPLYNYGLSLNKLFEYMAAEKPILFAGTSAENPAVLSGGSINPNTTVDEIAKAYDEILSMSETQLQDFGAKNLHYVSEHFDYPALTKRLASLLDEVAAPPA